MIKRRIVFSFYMLLTTLIAFSQADLQKIDRYIEKARQDWGVPGMAVAIVKDGAVVWSKGYGVLESEKPETVDKHTLFAIASNTKAFIASALGTLTDQGRLGWKDKVKNHLPYFNLYDSYATAEATVEDLLCHRLGLGTFSGDVIWYKSELSAEEVVKRARYVPQAYGFRDGYGYSNLMFIAAGEVIKAVTGQAWDEYIRKTFFVPMGMDRTITSTRELEGKGNFATPHKPVGERNVPIKWVNWDNMGAAGGIISSVDDMARWMIFQLNRGTVNGQQILSRSTQNLLWTPHNNHVVSDRSREIRPGRNFNGYGLGWGISDNRGRRIIAHGGGYDGMYSRVAMMPEENLGIVVLTNSMKSLSSAITDYIMERYIGAEEKDWSAWLLERQSDALQERVGAIKAARVMDTTPSLDPDSYTGTFHTPMYGDVFIKKEGESLRLEFSHSPLLSATLKHWHYDTWEIVWDDVHAWFGFGTVQFDFDSKRNIKGLRMDVPNYDIFFDELKLVKVNSPTTGTNK